jgi:hypothetical protein
MNNIHKFLEELKSLNFPIGEYVIVSSGPMAIRGIRECSDLDLIVSDSLFEKLCQSYPVVKKEHISLIDIGNISCMHKNPDPLDMYPTSKQIQDAEMIEGVPFQNLETCLYFKENSDREKDKRDVLLIREFLNQ